MTHLVKCLNGSGHDLTVHGFKPCTGLPAVSIEPASDPLSSSLSVPNPLCSLSLSLAKINKHSNIKKKKEGRDLLVY